MLLRRNLLRGVAPTRARRVPNPYGHVTKVQEVYGKYSKYFEEPENSVAKYTDKCAHFPRPWPPRPVSVFAFAIVSPL